MLRLIKKIYASLNKIIQILYRRKIIMECKSFHPPLFVRSYSNVTNKTMLGRNINFNGMRIKGNGNINIGDNFHSGEGCLMITSIHNFDSGNKIPYDNTNIDKDINIEDNVWLGDRVILLGGITIGEGAIIQAGSVVVSNIEKYAIAGGHPAKIFKYRDIEHYKKLKEKGEFH